MKTSTRVSMKATLLLLVCAVVCVRPSEALYEYGSNVITLTPSNFDQVFDQHVWIVEFYANWCGHCKNLAPIYEKVATNLKGIVKVAAVDADTHRSLAGQYGIQGFPTIKVFTSNSRTPLDYNGARDVRSMVSFATAQLPETYVHQLASNDDFAKFMSSSPADLARVVLFTDKARTATLYKAMSLEFKGRLVFGQLHKSTEAAQDLMAKYDVDSTPTLLVLQPQSEGEPKVHRYTDKIKALPLSMFLTGYAAPKAKEGEATRGNKKSGSGGQRATQPASIKLDQNNFAAEVLQRKDMIMVEFYAPWCGHCKRLAPEWARAANSLRGIVRFGAVDCDANKALCSQHGVQGYPTIKLFPHGVAEKRNPQDYQGPRTSQGLSQFAINSMPNLVQDLSGINMRARFTDDGGQSKVILFTKTPGKPMFKSLAAEFEGRLVFYEASAEDEAMMKQFQVSKVPALYVAVVPEDKREASVDEQQLQFSPYQGPLKRAAIAQFLSAIAPASDDGTTDGTAAASASEQEDEEIVQLTTQEAFESRCVKRTGLCVVVLMDTIDQDATERAGVLARMEKVRTAVKGKPFRFVWLDGAKQYKFLESLHYSSGYPGVVVMNARRKVYVPFVGRFDEESIEEWLEDVLRGRARSARLTEVPTVADESAEHDKKEL